MNALDELPQSPNLRELLDEGERAWNEEQKRRHAFWADADEGVKAEFILGEVIYHSTGNTFFLAQKLKDGTLVSEAVRVSRLA